jgi:hypothetical protein
MENVETELETKRHDLAGWRREQRDQQLEQQRSVARRTLASEYTMPEFAIIPLKGLAIDERYQRARNDSKIHMLRAFFHPNACQPLAISERANGTRYLVDGQHRAAVLEDIGVTEWPALLYRELTLQDEAAMWQELNTRQTKAKPTERFKAALQSREPEALAINAAVLKAGMRLNFKRGSKQKRTGKEIDAIDAVISIYRRSRESGLLDVLRTVQSAWPDPDELLRTARVMLLGISAFLVADWGHPVDLARVAAVLENYTPSKWIAMTRGVGDAGSPTEVLSGRIRLAYNKGLGRRDRLVPQER